MSLSGTQLPDCLPPIAVCDGIHCKFCTHILCFEGFVFYSVFVSINSVDLGELFI